MLSFKVYSCDVKYLEIRNDQNVFDRNKLCEINKYDFQFYVNKYDNCKKVQ